MKLTWKPLLGIVMLAAAVLPQAAHADSLAVTISNAVQSISTSGGDVTFSGTVQNTGTATEYINGYSVNLQLDHTDDSAFYDNYFSLAPGEIYNGVLFDVMLGSGLTPNTYLGSFSLYGGPGESDKTLLTSPSPEFQINVGAATNPPATPEPSSIFLLGTGALGMAGLLRRRFQQ